MRVAGMDGSDQEHHHSLSGHFQGAAAVVNVINIGGNVGSGGGAVAGSRRVWR
jgi:hypothetical protein